MGLRLPDDMEPNAGSGRMSSYGKESCNSFTWKDLGVDTDRFARLGAHGNRQR